MADEEEVKQQGPQQVLPASPEASMPVTGQSNSQKRTASSLLPGEPSSTNMSEDRKAARIHTASANVLDETQNADDNPGQDQEIKSDEDMTAVMSTMSPAEMRMVFEGFMNTGSLTDSQKQLLKNLMEGVLVQRDRAVWEVQESDRFNKRYWKPMKQWPAFMKECNDAHFKEHQPSKEITWESPDGKKTIKYFMDFKLGSQTNLSTGTVRKIRYWVPSLWSKIKDEDEDNMSDP